MGASRAKTPYYSEKVKSGIDGLALHAWRDPIDWTEDLRSWEGSAQFLWAAENRFITCPASITINRAGRQ